MLTIPALNSTRIRHGLLIRITVNGTVYRLANTWSPITWNSENYLALGHFLGTSEFQDDLRTTNNSIQITLSGIPADPEEPDTPSYPAIILNSRIKGSRVQIYRIFFDPVTQEFLADQTSLRFSGYISNFTITDGLDNQTRANTRTCVVQCSSVNAIIERRITGRRTNPTDQRNLYPADTGMDRVIKISNTSFDFGRPYTNSGTGGGSGSQGGQSGANQPDFVVQN